VNKREAVQQKLHRTGNSLYRADWGLDEYLHLCNDYNVTPYLTLDIKEPGTDDLDIAIHSAMALVAYVNGLPDDKRPIGVDAAGTDWKTVGYWASLRGRADYANRAEPFDVVWWEIGNESWGPDKLGSSMHWDLYAESFKAVAKAVKTIDQDIKVVANSRPKNTTVVRWDVKGLMRELKGVMDGFQIHPYTPWRYPDDVMERYRDTVVNGQVHDVIIRHFVQMLDETGNKDMPLFFSEWSDPKGWVWEYKGPDEYNWRDGKRMQTALHFADTVMTYLKHGQELRMAHYWLAWSPTRNANAFLQGQWDTHNRYYFNTTGYAQKLFIKNIGSDLVTCHVSGSPMFKFESVKPRELYRFDAPGPTVPDSFPEIVALATRTQNQIQLFMVNKHPTDTLPVTIDVRGISDAILNVTCDQVASRVSKPQDGEYAFLAFNSMDRQEATLQSSIVGLMRASFEYQLTPSSVTALIMTIVEE
jgi:alpha-L-arabinofuranosidase